MNRDIVVKTIVLYPSSCDIVLEALAVLALHDRCSRDFQANGMQAVLQTVKKRAATLVVEGVEAYNFCDRKLLLPQHAM